MLLSEREEKRKERVVAAAAWGGGGGFTRTHIKRKLMRVQFKNVPAFKYANEQEADT